MNVLDDPYTIALFSVCGAIVLFIIAQIFNKLILDPYLDYRKIKGQIAARLAFYDTFVNFPPQADAPKHSSEQKSEMLSELQWNLRRLSGELAGAYEMIPLRPLFIMVASVPRRSNLHKACSILLSISDNLWSDDPLSEIRLESNWFRRKRVARLLRIRWNAKRLSGIRK